MANALQIKPRQLIREPVTTTTRHPHRSDRAPTIGPAKTQLQAGYEHLKHLYLTVNTALLLSEGNTPASYMVKRMKNIKT